MEISACLTPCALIREGRLRACVFLESDDELSGFPTRYLCTESVAVSGHDVVGIRELLECFIPLFACRSYIESKGFISKCECFERCHRIVWSEFPISKSVGYTESMGCTDVAMIPHRCLYIGEAFLSDCFWNWCIAGSEEYREELCSGNIILCSIPSITVSVCESLCLEIEDRIFVPRVFYIGEISESEVRHNVQCAQYKERRDFFHRPLQYPFYLILQDSDVSIV